MNPWSKDLDNIFNKATEIARENDATSVDANDFMLAVMEEYKPFRDEMDQRKIGDRMIEELQKAVESADKISPSMKRIYTDNNACADRRVKRHMDLNRVIAEAELISHEEKAYYTGKFEIHHMLYSLYTANLSCWNNMMDETTAENICAKIGLQVMKENGIPTAGKHSFKAAVEDAVQKRNGGYSDRERVTEGGNEEPSNDNWAKYCTDMFTVGDQKPFIGRNEELGQLMQALCRRDKPNVILVGPPGVGKTDIVRGLAMKLKDGDVPEAMKGTRVFSVDLAGMLAGAEFRGSFEDRFKKVLEDASKMDRPILFFDEIHTIMGAGRASNQSLDAANMMKPYLTEGKIRIVGATTDDEFRTNIENDSAFMRRFQTVKVVEPSPKEAIQIIKGISNAYESFHGLKINQNAIETAVNMTSRYMHDRFLPDKAIDVLDQTCARVRLDQGKKVMKADVETTIAEQLHIPVQQMQADEMTKVRKLDQDIKKHVFGQDEAIDSLVEAVQMAKAGLNDECKPIGSFLFVGPSGVGKTEVSKQLAASLGIEFVRFDMSEYAESHSVAKLIGSPAGYVGYEDGGILVEKIRNTPHCVVLFDEIEKAHPDIYKIFLQILDYGMLTDNKGRKADFRNTVIIMTSNAGNSQLEKPKLGFGEAQKKDRRADTMKAVQSMMAPELRGRISATIVFNALDEKVGKMIVQKELKTLTIKLKAKGINVEYTDKTIDKIVETGMSAQYGAREIQRVIDQQIKKLFVKKIISGKTAGMYVVDVDNDTFVLNESENPNNDNKNAEPEKVAMN